MDAESRYLLQRIDCNCNNCGFMVRNTEQAQTQKGKQTPIFEGGCKKFNKVVTFIPDICQLDTQKCFIHRKDYIYA